MANLEAAEYEDVVLSAPIEMYDANNIVSNVGFNFTVGNTQGYVVLGTHSKAPLVNIFSEGAVLNTSGDIYCFSRPCFKNCRVLHHFNKMAIAPM